jgi:hypothetical protein
MAPGLDSLRTPVLIFGEASLDVKHLPKEGLYREALAP